MFIEGIFDGICGTHTYVGSRNSELIFLSVGLREGKSRLATPTIRHNEYFNNLKTFGNMDYNFP